MNIEQLGLVLEGMFFVAPEICGSFGCADTVLLYFAYKWIGQEPPLPQWPPWHGLGNSNFEYGLSDLGCLRGGVPGGLPPD